MLWKPMWICWDPDWFFPFLPPLLFPLKTPASALFRGELLSLASLAAIP